MKVEKNTITLYLDKGKNHGKSIRNSVTTINSVVVALLDRIIYYPRLANAPWKLHKKVWSFIEIC